MLQGQRRALVQAGIVAIHSPPTVRAPGVKSSPTTIRRCTPENAKPMSGQRRGGRRQSGAAAARLPPITDCPRSQTAPHAGLRP